MILESRQVSIDLEQLMLEGLTSAAGINLVASYQTSDYKGVRNVFSFDDGDSHDEQRRGDVHPIDVGSRKCWVPEGEVSKYSKVILKRAQHLRHNCRLPGMTLDSTSPSQQVESEPVPQETSARSWLGSKIYRRWGNLAVPIAIVGRDYGERAGAWGFVAGCQSCQFCPRVPLAIKSTASAFLRVLLFTTFALAGSGERSRCLSE